MAIRKPTTKTITSTSLKQDLQDIQGRISNIAAGEMTSEVDDFLIDIYEKLDTIFHYLYADAKWEEATVRPIEYTGPYEG